MFVDIAKFQQDTKYIIDKELNIGVFCFEVTPTQGCNCKCSYCFETNHELVNMTNEELYTSIAYIKRLLEDKWFMSNFKGINLTFWGGEPTLCEDIILTYIKFLGSDPRVFWHIYTNGTRKKQLQQIVEHLEAFGSLSRLSVQISYDGFTHDMHRVFKNGNSLTSSVALDTARYLRGKKGLRLSFKSTILPQDFKLLHETWKSFKDICVEFNKGKDINRDTLAHWCPTIDQAYNDTVDYSEDLKESLSRILADEVNFISEHKYPVLTWVDSAIHLCGHGGNMCCMDVDGSIYTCHGVMYFDSKLKKDECITSIHKPYLEFLKDIRSKIEENQGNNATDLFPEDCKNCLATHCAICNACSASLSNKETPLERWYDRTLQPKLCKYYKIYGLYNIAFQRICFENAKGR